MKMRTEKYEESEKKEEEKSEACSLQSMEGTALSTHGMHI